MNPNTKEQRTYLAIDLKSFYASAEAVSRSLDPLTTNLVVADASRTEKTICLAVSPSLKACGISGRARLFEVVQKVKEVNHARLTAAIRAHAVSRGKDGQYHFTAASSDANLLAADPSLELSYIIAPPRMKLYEEISARIVSIYLKYVSMEDLIVYSIDEVFIDATGYLKTYHMTARELVMKMIRDVLRETGITATAGIGTNLFLTKVAMDIVAKHVPADADGVRIAELDENSYRELLWCHHPLTDFWRIGKGSAARLEAMGLYTMGDIARASMIPVMEDRLYKAFGVNAELIIDHAWGWEPCDIQTIKSYRPSTTSISSGQVLSTPYDYEKGLLIVREMTELLVLDLVRKQYVTKQVVLNIGYDHTSLEGDRGKRYTGPVSKDRYGKSVPKDAHGTGNTDHYTSSTRLIMDTMTNLYQRIVDPDLLIRRINVTAANLIREDEIPEEAPVQLDMFTDFEALTEKKKKQQDAEARERQLQHAALSIQSRFGKNALLKGMNLMEGATTIERNGQIGGHKAGATIMPMGFPAVAASKQTDATETPEEEDQR